MVTEILILYCILEIIKTLYGHWNIDTVLYPGNFKGENP